MADQQHREWHSFIVGEQGGYVDRYYGKGEKVTIPKDRLPATSWFNLNGSPVEFDVTGEGKNRKRVLREPGASPAPAIQPTLALQIQGKERELEDLRARAAAEQAAGTMSSLRPPAMDPNAPTMSEAVRGRRTEADATRPGGQPPQNASALERKLREDAEYRTLQVEEALAEKDKELQAARAQLAAAKKRTKPETDDKPKDSAAEKVPPTAPPTESSTTTAAAGTRAADQSPA